MQRLFFSNDRAVAVLDHHSSGLSVQNVDSYAPRPTESALLGEGDYKGTPL